ncbi:hypothetical protein F503_01309 [Ophiostoma piceae UAMH 11346]|uniref:C3H1-type domain-containing protein n=1 Tax=Ophiostoma piceae (strain UAMH 11346) TaxID=1262450 RepID=S3CUD1_OPHP1|nr:hypothetical protein F503_01309 [Ophiostoma piceae UAMH 11346]
MSFRGNRRGGSGIRPAMKSGQACRQFKSTGMCAFGQRCKFSHDPSSSSASAPRRTYTQAPRIREPTDERVLKFKRLVTARTYGTSSSEQNPFSLGLEILTNVKDADAQQQTISILATEDGLSCIRQVVESRIPRAMIAGTTFAKRRLWETDMRPLFRLITFESVVLSNILEDKVVTIYNFIAGVGGDRLPAWFDLAKGLAGAPDLPLSIASIEIAELCLAVMAKMMDCNSSHVSNPTFCDYATSFIAIATAFQDITPAHKMSKIQATEHAAIISRRLEARDTSSSARSLHSALANGSLSLHQDLPGSLSGNGPRHDNDHDDITKISILPTPDEIASDRKEYLPTDTIGQLRDVVRAELGNLQQKSNHGKPLKDTIQYCTYHDTSIFELGFDRRTGPEFIFRFRQPAGRSGTTSFQRGKAGSDKNDEEAKSLAQRRDWWMVRAKKRLQPGGLVCVIDSRGASHFLIVADSSARTAADTQKHQNGPANRSWQKDDDDGNGKTFTLADDPMWSFVSLKLPPDNNRDQLRDIMTQLFFKTKIKRFARSGSWVREHEPSCVLVEFPGILLDSFLPTLQALQATTTSLKVPFAKLLTAADNTSFDSTTGDMASIPPPKYAQLPGFEFNLSCLSQSGAGQTHLLSHGVDAPITAQEVEKQTRLDMTQSAALVDALSRSVALVQGPPGTGKTFAGVEILKVLLQNSKKANMGPILIVCYTNHALDQLLEHVLDARPKTQVIRMGSRSKSERLRDLNLFELSRTEERTRNERSSLYEFGLELDELTADFQKLSDKLTRSMSFSSIAAFLHDHHRSYSMQLFGSGSGFGDGVDDQGYTMVQQSKDKIFLAWMRGGRTDTENGNTPPPATAKQETMTEIRKRLQLLEDAAGLDILALNADERNVLYQKWQYESFTMAADAICREYEKFVSTKKSYDYARRETDLRCLQRAEIVGVTTTGLARNNNLLKNLRAKVLLCEEAGEVLEAHMLTSLLPSLEHLILIGDHQQLRPQVQNYDLRSDSARGAQYSFDMSLFERLVSPLNDEGVRLPFSQLFTQRRMHPSISDLIRAPLYPSLQDGSNVFEHPEVPGIERRLFWLQHDQLEQGASSNDRQADPTSTSRTNLFEVEMTAALVSHLFKQGAYGPGDIAVLTPYLGQMMLLQRRMSSMFEISFNERDEAEIETIAAVHAGKTVGEVSGAGVGDTGKAGVIARTTLSNSVRIATVDNFQGEEAKVVVISMVRSNEQHRCGFLSTSNRINVLLSRAKHGMYIIGNSDTCSRVPMWQQVIGNLEDGGNIGPALPLRCPRHPERRFEASRPEHFLQFAPDGGCLEPCSKPLPCKHRVDLTKATTYGSTNLDEDPCIFLNCGHVLAASYVDNVAGMHIHYEMEAGTSGSPVSIRTPLAHFVTTEASTCCPYCRGRLYDVARYSRIVKQRQWDRSIQKASLLCKERLTVLAINLMGAMMADTLNRRQPISSRKNLWSSSRLKLMSSSSRTLVITKLLMPASLLRYQPLLELRDRISSLSAETRKNEQACQIVTIFGENGENKASSASRGEMRMGGYRQTRLLLLRCDAMALADIARSLLSLRKALNTTSALKDSVVDMALFNEVLAVMRDNRLACFFKDCVLAFKDAQMAQNTRQENEAIRIYISFYVSHGVLGKLVLSWPLATAKVSGLKSIQEQDEFRQGFEEQRLKLDIEYKKYADLSPMQKKDVNNYSALVAVEDVPALISYSKACLAEMAASYKGMYAEFHGMSGRWYACANGHPFTTKGDTLSREEEMESVRCPECNAPAGGQQSGVDNIDDMDDVDELVDLGRHIEEMHV